MVNPAVEIPHENSSHQETDEIIVDYGDNQMRSFDEGDFESETDQSSNHSDSETATEDESEVSESESEVEGSGSEVEGSESEVEQTEVAGSESEGEGSESEVEGSESEVEDAVRCSKTINATIESNLKLYPGSSKTLDESILKVIESYTDDSSMTLGQLQKQLRTLCDLLPDNHVMPNTTYLLFKYISRLGKCDVTKHFYCKNCLYYRGLINDQANCSACSSSRGNSVFFELDIFQQIKYFFEHKKLAEIIKPFDKSRTNVDCISDVRDGSE